MPKKRGLHAKRRPGEPRGGRGKPVNLTIHRKSRHMQRWFLYNPWVRPFVVFSFAATKIQKLARGFLIRRHEDLYAWMLYRRRLAEGLAMRRQQSSQLDKYLSYVDLMKKGNSRLTGRSKPLAPPKWLNGGYSVWCGVRIQAWYRGQVTRRRYLYRTRVINQIGALVIQNGYKQHYHYKQELKRRELQKRRAIKEVITPVRASVTIQLAWRACSNRRIYHYYHDLVVNKLQGAPQDLLKTIIPNESSLLDKAAGVIVRFRLGGAIFPPKVYFKIFTYRGVCDVNAFAPRDYAQEKPIEAFQQNIKSTYIPKDRRKYNKNIRVGNSYFETQVNTTAGVDSWYKRDERNPWRPLASSLFEDLLTPPWMKDEVKEKPPAPFHFSQLKRKTDQIKLRKKKKRDWLRKAYMLAGADATATQGHSGSQAQQFTDMQKKQKEQHQLQAGRVDGRVQLSNSLSQVYYDKDNSSSAVGSGADGANPRKGSAGMGYNQPHELLSHKGARTYSADMNNDPRRRASLGNMSGVMDGGDGGGEDDTCLHDGSISESLAYLSMSHTLDSPSANPDVRKSPLGNGPLHRIPSSNIVPDRDRDEVKFPRIQADSAQRMNFQDSRHPYSQHYQRLHSPSTTQVGPNNQNHAQYKYKDGREGDGDFKSHGSNNESEENDDLLQWSQALDYDDYATGWKSIATSGPSDANRLYQ